MVSVLSKLGELLAADTEERTAIIASAAQHNPWFTPENVLGALTGIITNLQRDHLMKWLRPYAPRLGAPEKQLNIGLVLAGNIPLVGFHDILCVLVSGHRAAVKLSSQDKQLSAWLLKKIKEASPEYASRITVSDILENPDAVIATGSNNSARYFEQYFGRYPHIIRKNRNAAALITGGESKKELELLGEDIFRYFGLGCRSVSKLYVPRDYDFQPLLEALEPFRKVIYHHKYANNYEYQLSIRLMNKEPHFTNGFIILLENTAYASPIATLHYEYYGSEGELTQRLQEDAPLLQCIASSDGGTGVFPEAVRLPGSVRFGQTQCPALWDYADQVDTLDFLMNLGKRPPVRRTS